MDTHSQIRTYVAACMGMMGFGISFTVMGAILPSISMQYQLGEMGEATLVAFLPLGILVGSLLFGPVADRFGYKLLQSIASLLIAGGLLGLVHSESLEIFRICIFFIGLGGGILNGGTNALVSDIYDGSCRASKLSLLGVFYGIGALGMPLLISMLSKYYDYQSILQWTAYALILSVVYNIFISFPMPKHKQGFPVKKALKMVRNPLLLVLGFVLFFQSALEGLINNWSTSYLSSEVGLTDNHSLNALVANVLGITLARLALSYILKEVKSGTVLMAGVIFVAIGIILLYFTTNTWLPMIALFVIGVGLAGVFPIIIGLVGNMFREMSGTAIGILLFIALSGNTILNYLMGVMTSKFGLNVFPLFLIICLIFQVLLILVSSKKINSTLNN